MGNRMNIVNLGPWVDPVSSSQGTTNSTSDESLPFVLEFTIQKPEPQTEKEQCKQLIGILNNLLTRKIPRCLMEVNAAYLFEGIVTHAFFNYIGECERSTILDQIRAFSAIKGNSVNVPSLSVITLIPWISRTLNISRMQTSIVLGDFLQLSPERCFTRFPLRSACVSSHAQRECFPLPESLVTDGYLYRLITKYPIRGVDGQILQMVCRYSAGDAHVTVYADSSMRFGIQELPALLPARDLIEANPRAEIHLCLCADVLWRYITLASEGKLAEREGVVVTGNFGAESELWALDLSSLLFHPVVTLCPKDRPEYGNVEKFTMQCLASVAESVRVFTAPIVNYEGKITDDYTYRSQVEGNLAEVINLNNVESVSALARYIRNHSVMNKDIMISKSTEDSHEHNRDQEFKLLSLDDMQSLHSTHVSSSDVTMRDLFKASQRTMIFGDTNVGKSYIAQCMALSISSGTECFCFSKSKPSKVVYLDGEMGDTFIPRLKMLGGGELNPLVKQNLKGIPLRGGDESSPQNKEIVINELESFSPYVVIIDNIISLFGEAVKGNVVHLKSFVEELEKKGIAVVLVHHTSKSAETYKGPIELAALCQNVIHLKSRAQIVEEFAKEARSVPPRMAALMEAKEIGPLVSMTFTKCKICPELEKEQHYFYLPINGQWSRLEIEASPMCITEMENEAGDILPNAELPSARNVVMDIHDVCDGSHDTAMKSITTPDVELTDDKQLILEAAKKSPISNKYVWDILKCSESKASMLL